MAKSKPKSKHSFMDLFEGIIIGGSLAAAATFLFATKKGKEMRKKFVHQYRKLGRTTKKMRDKIEHAIHVYVPKKQTVKRKAKRHTHRKAA